MGGLADGRQRWRDKEMERRHMSLIRKRPTSAAWQHYNDIMHFSVNMQNAIICPNTHCLFSVHTLLFCLTTDEISHLLIYFLNYLNTCFQGRSHHFRSGGDGMSSVTPVFFQLTLV